MLLLLGLLCLVLLLFLLRVLLFLLLLLWVQPMTSRFFFSAAAMEFPGRDGSLQIPR